MAGISSLQDSDESTKTSSDLWSELDIDLCAEDFANYMKVDVSPQVKTYEDIIEDMLVRLDEFCQTADMVRNESGMIVKDLLPRITSQSAELPAIFDKIDKLERFVAVVKNSVDCLEDRVNQAEKDLGTSKVKGFLSSLPIKRFQQKKDATKPTAIHWTPLVLTNLKQYFEKEQERTFDANNA